MTAAKKKPTSKKTGKNNKKKAGAKTQKSNFSISPMGVGAILAVSAVLLMLLFIFVSPAGKATGAGVLLQAVVKLFALLLGIGRFVLPPYLGLLAVAFFLKDRESFHFVRFIIFSSVLFLLLPTFFCIDQEFITFSYFMTIAAGGETGGVIGGIFAYGMLLLFSEPVSIILLILFALISVLMLTNFSLPSYLQRKGSDFSERRQERKEAALVAEEEEELLAAEAPPMEEKYAFAGEPPVLRPHRRSKKRKPVPGRKQKKIVEYAGNDRVIIDGMIFTKDIPSEDYTPISFREHITGRDDASEIAPVFDGDDHASVIDLDAGIPGENDETVIEEAFSVQEIEGRSKKREKATFEEVVPLPEVDVAAAAGKKKSEKIETLEINPENKEGMSHFSPPSTSILKKGGTASQKQTAQNIRSGITKLEKTLESFGVQARVTEVSCGPSIIRYEVQPGPGVKVSKIVNLADDIALQLAATDIRMEAPVPGKSVIGIEVPRKDTVAVPFRDILENSRFFDLPSKLTCAYGQDIAGNPVIGDLAAMPHLLIAGTTGSGKSVCMNTMICSILFKAMPDQVKFIMIDPKQVEFIIYEGLPHLITPVVTDPKKAAGALKWALREMENRYTLFNQNRVRNLEGYNALVETDSDRLPQIVIFIDELADLMMVAAKEVEATICRLAQKARAAGIHLVVATQRPSVDVITGLIKANIPSRIALMVSSQTDSRTILDTGGAEKLLGKGDMLYMPVGYSKPVRVQGAWISEKEAEAILEHYKKQGEPDYIEGVAQSLDTGSKEEAGASDALFFDAGRAAVTAGQASTSMMQRRFRIGYNHAARIMEELEEKGVIGPADGARPRTVLMSPEVFAETFKEPKEQSLFDE